MNTSNSSLAQQVPPTEFPDQVPAGLLALEAQPLVDPGSRPGGRSPGSRRARGEAERVVRDSAAFGPDVILPEQFYDRSVGMEEVSGERALMLAVLEDGIRCFQEHLRSPRVRPRLLARQAEKWIRSSDWDWPFSFNNICESLALDPDSLRERLLTPQPCGDAPPRPRPSSHRVYRLTPRVKPPRRR
jgi:hypothetical protein